MPKSLLLIGGGVVIGGMTIVDAITMLAQGKLGAPAAPPENKQDPVPPA